MTDAPDDGLQPDEKAEVESQTEDAAAGTSPTATPLTHLGTSDGVRGDSGATAELAKFLSRTPFLDLHDRAGGDGPDGTDHRLRRRLCFCADALIRVVAILLIFVIVAAVVYKTLAPLPHLW